MEFRVLPGIWCWELVAELEAKRGWSWWKMEVGNVVSLQLGSLKALQTDAF